MGNWVAAIQRVGGVRFPKGLRSTRGLIGSKLSHSLSIGFGGQRQSTAFGSIPERGLKMPNFRKWRHHGARGRAVVLNEGSRRVTVAYSGAAPIPRKTVYGGRHRSYKQRKMDAQSAMFDGRIER